MKLRSGKNFREVLNFTEIIAKLNEIINNNQKPNGHIATINTRLDNLKTQVNRQQKDEDRLKRDHCTKKCGNFNDEHQQIITRKVKLDVSSFNDTYDLAFM